LIDCRFSSVWDGANMGGTLGVFVERCMFETTGGPNVCHALQTPGSGVYRDCIFNAVTSTTGSSRHGAIEIGSGYTVRAVFENCYFNTSAPAGRTGDVFGVYVNYASSAVVLNGCIFNTVGPDASGGPKDLYNAAGNIIVNGCSYSTYSGTITQGDSRWASAVKAQAGAAIDENTSLQKTIKMLKNKAVLDKLSGEIRYFDDDGQTVILTHTPNENESSLTRMAS
jgi:hypothetical protein